MLRILRQRCFPIAVLRVFARSSRDITVDNELYHVETIENSDFSGIDIALFAGTEGAKGASITYAQKFIDMGAVVIDNGSDFRLKSGVPLVVPEANGDKIFTHKGLIANPNCTTIQAIVALSGIYKKLGLRRILLVSFQATSGAGAKAVECLWDETIEVTTKNKSKYFPSAAKLTSRDFPIFGHQIAFNVIPQIGSFGDDGYTTEEYKVVEETHKIFNDKTINISATCARVPVFTGHSEAIYFETKENAGLEEIAGIIKTTPGVNFKQNCDYPAILDIEGSDNVYVSRLREDSCYKNSFWIWVVADNLRKGAALNAVEIAQALIA